MFAVLIIYKTGDGVNVHEVFVCLEGGGGGGIIGKESSSPIAK